MSEIPRLSVDTSSDSLSTSSQVIDASPRTPDGGLTPKTPTISDRQSGTTSHDLPADLLAIGWRKFWSERENMHYYYNKLTRESKWVIPEAPRVRLAKGPFWDISVVSNVWTRVHDPYAGFPPHPQLEQQRAVLVAKLRRNYQEICLNREGIDAPVESFNRWLLERMVIDSGDDPFFPSNCGDNTMSPSMYREIINDIPTRLRKPKYVNEARHELLRYAEAAKRTIERRSVSSESRKVVKWNAEECFSWLRQKNFNSFEDNLERLAHLKRQCQPHLIEAVRSSVENICKKVMTQSVECAAKLKDIAVAMYEEQNVKLTKGLRCRYPPLEELYKWNAKDDPRYDHFLSRVWCLLSRYKSLFGPSSQEGSGLQGALPLDVFECLKRIFGVTFECFASPFNCYFRQYSSAFPDTDSYFGSRGRILDFKPISGSFEANPPFSEELLEAMVEHFEALLNDSNEPLSFIIFMPEWRDPPPESLIRLEASKFKRAQILIDAFEHDYRHGCQHYCPDREIDVTSSHGTSVIFLQNDAGFNRWGPTSDRISELRLAYVRRDSIYSKNKDCPTEDY